VAVADFNGDGSPDLVVGNSFAGVVIGRSDGAIAKPCAMGNHRSC
jgi:hypothetical protein